MTYTVGLWTTLGSRAAYLCAANWTLELCVCVYNVLLSMILKWNLFNIFFLLLFFWNKNSLFIYHVYITRMCVCVCAWHHILYLRIPGLVQAQVPVPGSGVGTVCSIRTDSINNTQTETESTEGDAQFAAAARPVFAANFTAITRWGRRRHNHMDVFLERFWVWFLGGSCEVICICEVFLCSG